MCLAIYKPANKIIKLEELEAGFNSNRDGAGFAYVKGGRIHIEKGFFKYHDFLKAYLKHEKRQMLIHFRLATHGAEDAFNCHPWPCAGGKFAVIHNGILSYPSSAEKSDTGHFVDEVLAPILSQDANMFDNPGLAWLIEESIGTGNKIVILREDGQFKILNEKQGLWHEGSWFSNTCFRGYGHSWQQSYRGVAGAGSARSMYDEDDQWWDHRYAGAQNPSLGLVANTGAFGSMAETAPSEIETSDEDDPFKDRLTEEEVARFDWMSDLFPFLFEAGGCATLEEAERVIAAIGKMYKAHSPGAENMDSQEIEAAMSKEGYAEQMYATIPTS